MLAYDHSVWRTLLRKTSVGFLSLQTTVCSSTTRVSARLLTFARVGNASLGSIQRSKWSFTSCAVSGAPQWNLTFFLRWKVHVRPSADVSQRSASAGRIFIWKSWSTRPS